MGKRSNFKRVARDAYDTPVEAVLPLLPFLSPHTHFIEPCAGAGALADHLEAHGMRCIRALDIGPRSPHVFRHDLLALARDQVQAWRADCFITNPPWQRPLLHRIIERLRALDLPAWLLLDANWMFTRQAAPFLKYCSLVVTVGRVKWIPGTTMTGKDDAAWMLFMPNPVKETRFVGKGGGHT